MSYEGDGYFRVLTTRDERVFVHRDRLRFAKGAKIEWVTE
jgi:hypothetical protein